MPEVVLAAEQVERVYGSGSGEIQAVRGIDLTVEPGDLVLVMGPSGSGKTTLLSMIGGLLTPSAGRILLGGEDLYARGDDARADLRLKRLGFVFQSFNLLSALSARENVEVPMRMNRVAGAQARLRASELLDSLGLSERLEHRPRDLSGGEKQRVAIARALANDPDLVLADEPTANLDSKTGREVSEILRRLGREEGKGVLIVSHDQRLLDVATRVVWLEDGRLTEGARPALPPAETERARPA